MAIELKSPRQIDSMRRAGALLWEILTSAADRARLGGMTTAELDARIEEDVCRAGAVAVLRGYRGQSGDAPPFPGCACISINEEVVHAPPGPRILRPGDTVTVDCALSLDGWCADAAVALTVGEADPARSTVAAGARELVEMIVAAAHPGRRWSDVAEAGLARAAAAGLELVGDFAGHGIGRSLHEPPAVRLDVPRQPGGRGLDFVLRPGMTFTVEPVLVAGGTRIIGLNDGWTVVTADRSPAAHEERTIAITRQGARVLTG